MGSGIRATVEFPTPEICPITELSAKHNTTIDTVSTSVCPPESSINNVSEFSMSGEEKSQTDMDMVFSFGTTKLWRFSHDTDPPCPCECLGEFGCPVARYRAQNGTLTLVFHAADYDELQLLITELRETYSVMAIKRLIRSPTETSPPDTVFVDRSKLTDRQHMVLETAFEMGYFDWPRQSNATDIAAELDISPSTFSEHLAAVQRKLFTDILE